MKVISLNKFEDFLVLQRVREDAVYEGEVKCHEVICIDAHDQCFYPDSAKVRKIMQKWNAVSKNTEEIAKKYRMDLEREWLDTTV
jgi:hypothetical protein